VILREEEEGGQVMVMRDDERVLCEGCSLIHSVLFSRLDVLRICHTSCTKKNTESERNAGICDTGTFRRFCRSWVWTIRRRFLAVRLAS